MRHIKSLFLMFLILSTLIAADQKIIGYYPYWVTDYYSPAKIPMAGMTHLIHSFMWPEADGSVGHPNNFFAITPSLINTAHANGCKVIFSIGGAGYGTHFDAVFADSDKRAKFVNGLVDICIEYGYDGVDIDWEQPDTQTDKQNLNLFVKDLHDAIEESLAEISISMAVPASDWRGKFYDTDFLKNYIAWFGVMTYDFYGSWSSVAGHNSSLYKDPTDPQNLTVDSAIKDYWHNTKKVPYDQLVSGIPFYGYQFAGANAPYKSFTSATYISYKEIEALSNFQYNWNPAARVPYLINGTNFITFDDTVSVRHKCEYAREKELGGVMIWEISQDFYAVNNQPLLNTVIREMHKPTAIESDNSEMIREFSISQNYPNPFNSTTNFRVEIAKNSHLELSVYDICGNLVTTLYNDDIELGKYNFQWHVTGNSPSGVYFLHAKTENNFQSMKMIYLK